MLGYTGDTVSNECSLTVLSLCPLETVVYYTLPLWYTPRGGKAVCAPKGTTTSLLFPSGDERRAKRRFRPLGEPEGVSPLGPCIVAPKGQNGGDTTLP